MPDPRLPVTPGSGGAVRPEGQIRDRLSEVHEAVNQLRRVRKQVEGWEERLKAAGEEQSAQNGAGGHETVLAAAKDLKEKLKGVEEALIQTEPDQQQPGPSRLKDQLAGLSVMIDESDDAPTRGATEVYERLAERVAAERATLRQLLAEDVRRFDELVRAAAIPAIVV